jgi:adenylate kinase
MSSTTAEIDYLRAKRVPELFESIMAQLLAARPESPYLFLRELLAKPLTPKVIIAGPPAAGKGTQCEAIVAAFGVVHVSTGDLLREEVKEGSAVGKQAEQFMKSGQLVPDEIIIAMVERRLSKPDVRERGWLLDGFPRTAFQAAALNKAGIVPQAFVLLDVPDAVVTDRISGRRTDPTTNKVYHLTFNPPPAGDAALAARLVQRSDDTKEAIGARLATYHKNLGDIIGLYEAVLARVDGNREVAAISADVTAAVKQRLLK